VEAWTVTKKDEQAVLIFERKIFRRICGPKYENGEWTSRMNRELEEMSKGKNIVKCIKGQRISWLGHLERMEEDRMPKISSLKSWKGREEGEDPGKDGKRKKKEIFKCWELEDGESWWQMGKNGRTLFDRPKPAVGCSANERRRSTCVSMDPSGIGSRSLEIRGA